MTSLYVVRHGQAAGNLDGRFQGWTDTPLTPLGERQAKALSERFSALPVSRVYASPLIRAMETARPLAARHGLEPEPEAGLLEMGVGDYEDVLIEELRRRDPQGMANFRDQPHLFAAPGGETAAGVRDRVVKSVLRLARENMGSVLVAVTHGFAIRCLFNWAAGKPLEQLRDTRLGPNASVSHIVFNERLEPALATLNDVSHLLPEEQSGFFVR